MITPKWNVREGSEWTLREAQVKALGTLATVGRGFFCIGVGGGKTLTAMMAAEALGVAPEETLVLTRARLVDEAYAEAEIYSRHFKFEIPEYWSYAHLSRHEQDLRKMAPKLIVADEAHFLKNPKSTRGRAFVRYCRDHPEVVFVPMTGTITNSSILDYAHLLALALGRENCPLPDPWKHTRRLEALARVIDPNPRTPPDAADYRIAATVLNQQDGEDIRSAYFRVLRDTPGVIVSEDPSFDGPIHMTKWTPPCPPPIMDALVHLDSTGQLPNGMLASDPLTKSDKENQIASGFYYYPVYTEMHTPKWNRAKLILGEYVAAVLRSQVRKKTSRLVTEARVIQAIRTGELDAPEMVKLALSITDLVPEPEQEEEWISDEILLAAIERCRETRTETRGSLLWYNHTALRHRLAELCKGRYSDVHIAPLGEPPPRGLDAPVVGVVSTRSHTEGFNLQRDYRYNLVLGPESNAGLWEQLFGRTHRPGQEEEVELEYLATWAGHRNRVGSARKKAKYIEETTGQPQRIIMACTNQRT